MALNFVISYLYNKLPRRRVDMLAEELERGLKKKFEGHWYPDKPCKGSGFRCVRVNGEKVDPVIVSAAFECGLVLEEVKSYLPEELTLWIDPSEVSYRIGEKGQVKILYSDRKDEGNDGNSRSRSPAGWARIQSGSSMLHADRLFVVIIVKFKLVTRGHFSFVTDVVCWLARKCVYVTVNGFVQFLIHKACCPCLCSEGTK